MMTAAQLTTALDSYLAARSAAGEFAGVVLVAKDGEMLFERGYGPADRERNTPMQSALRFNVASIGKAFTKVAVGQLVAQGKLALTDTIAMRLPDHPNKDAMVATIEQLLAHTGGVADFFGPDFDAAPKERFGSNADYYRFVAQAAYRRSRHSQSVLQRLLHRARRDHRQGLRHALRELHHGARLQAGRHDRRGLSLIQRPGGRPSLHTAPR